MIVRTDAGGLLLNWGNDLLLMKTHGGLILGDYRRIVSADFSNG
jgi:hypothetical protein